jgi:hypothetical protein
MADEPERVDRHLAARDQGDAVLERVSQVVVGRRAAGIEHQHRHEDVLERKHDDPAAEGRDRHEIHRRREHQPGVQELCAVVAGKLALETVERIDLADHQAELGAEKLQQRRVRERRGLLAGRRHDGRRVHRHDRP